MNGDNGTSTQAPQMRALLFTDLCDSLILVERIGDAAAAELFQQHDRLVLTLQQQWNGHQIDRSDGLFLLFDRAIDALGFALDYQRGLQEIGKQRNIVLRARAGLHVGEVLTWENSPEAIKVGAKSLEVEGLAKPMAARLMTLARPGQILLSAVAESLTHRATGELGERGEQLLWRSHGRWRFKGLPARQEVFEVGEIGFAPLRMPRGNAKARRDLPLWRQPAALAAEVLLVVVAGVGGWMMLRPEPAIAFAERDWVVIGDVRNLTGNVVLDDSLQQAFRISLEQSRHVNVLSDMKARGIMELMRRQPGAPLDATSASEVALRAGAQLVLLPTVSEMGGRARISVEVLEPHSQQTLAVASADGEGVQSLLGSIDQVTTRLRDQLGEGKARLKVDSMPLPLVTTSSLDALRAYALGQRRYGEGDYRGALAMYERSVQLDPNFALAWMGQVRARVADVDKPGALAVVRRLKSLSYRLPAREELYLDAWFTTLTDQSKAADAWMQLASLYPDYFSAQHNAAIWLYTDNRYAEAFTYASRAADSRFELSNIAYDQLGRIALARGDQAGARRALETAVAGGRTASHRYLAAVAASERNYAEADKHLAQSTHNRHAGVERISIAADRGQWQRAEAEAAAGVSAMAGETGFDRQLYLLPQATVQWAAGNREAALKSVRAAADSALKRLADKGNPDASEDAMMAMGTALLAARMGDMDTSSRVLGVIHSGRDAGGATALDEMRAVVAAERLRLTGDAPAAMQKLRPFLRDTSRFQTRVAAMNTLRALGRNSEALAQADFLRSNRGMAYAELDCGYCMQAMNVTDSNAASRIAAELRGGKRVAGLAVADLLTDP